MSNRNEKMKGRLALLSRRRYRFFFFKIIISLLCLSLIIINLDSPSTNVLVDIPLSVQIPISVYSLSKLILNRTIPSIPTRLNDWDVLVQQVRTSRLYSGGSAVFLLHQQQRRFIDDLWCLFEKDLITPVYRSDLKIFDEQMILLECNLPQSIRHSLWFNRTNDRDIRIYLSTSTDILLQGLLTAPWTSWAEDNEQSLTLCTQHLDISQTYLLQWIDYHRLVGIRKFVIYSLDKFHQLDNDLLEFYDEEYPGLIDIIRWNDSFVGMDIDCFIHYGDLSEWIGVIDMNEYLIPPQPYQTLSTFLTDKYGRQLQVSVPLENQEFFSYFPLKNSNNDSFLSQNILRSRFPSTSISNKSLRRPRDFNRNSNEIPMEKIILAQYQIRLATSLDQFIIDTSIRDRFYSLFQ